MKENFDVKNLVNYFFVFLVFIVSQTVFAEPAPFCFKRGILQNSINIDGRTFDIKFGTVEGLGGEKLKAMKWDTRPFQVTDGVIVRLNSKAKTLDEAKKACSSYPNLFGNVPHINSVVLAALAYRNSIGIKPDFLSRSHMFFRNKPQQPKTKWFFAWVNNEGSIDNPTDLPFIVSPSTSKIPISRFQYESTDNINFDWNKGFPVYCQAFVQSCG